MYSALEQRISRQYVLKSPYTEGSLNKIWLTNLKKISTINVHHFYVLHVSVQMFLQHLACLLNTAGPIIHQEESQNHNLNNHTVTNKVAVNLSEVVAYSKIILSPFSTEPREFLVICGHLFA